MKLLQDSTRRFALFFLRSYPGRTALMVGLLSMAGLLEGVGVLSLLPLLNVAFGTSTEASQGALGDWVREAMAMVGLTPSVGSMLGVLVVAITGKAVIMWLAMRQVGFTVASVTRDLRLQLVDALLRARWSYFGGAPIGQFSNAITNEADRAAAAYKDGCLVLGSSLQVGVYLAVAMAIAWHASLAGIVLGLLMVFLLKHFISMNRSAGDDLTDLMKGLSGRLVDALKGIKPVKAMAKERLFLPLFAHEVEGMHSAQMRQVIAGETLALLFEPIVTIVLAVGLYVALVYSPLTFSSILVLAFVFYRILRHISTAQSKYLLVAGGESAFWSLRTILDRARDQVEHYTGTREVNGLDRSIRLASVTFGFGGTTVLSDVSLTIPAGTLVTLVGGSGAGKTTLGDLITGLYNPTSGTIYVDDIPLEEIDPSSWRSHIGYVPQELLLFNDTILRNITLGEERYSRAEAERALRAAGAWEFVASRDGGLDTQVGEGGGFFSGGQRQRIAIARALVGSPALLILDEVTASLDPESEAAICETLLGLRGTVTILAISHQKALQDAADLVYLVESGTVRPARESEQERTHSTAGSP